MKSYKSYPVVILLTVLLVMLTFSSCSTKKNTWTRRQYHNLTCHYNVYWNGMISLDEGKVILEERVKDNYEEVLPIYNYGTEQDASTINPKMDRAIKKASIGIQRHSMQSRGKELIKWVRESYLMMGKAYFYKQDYISARRVFEFISKEYDPYPIQYEGLLWLGKTYLYSGSYEKAEAILNLLQSKINEENFPRDVEIELPLAYADFYIAKKDYYNAYTFVERGLELPNKKEIKTRLYFILGQINQLEGNYKTASENYDKVIKRSPDYVMAFEARINMAHCYAEGEGDSKYINKVLLKMAKESKNKEFLDQIYYALASIADKDNNDTLVIHYLKKSVSSSVNNQIQKTTSALELADIYFADGNYNMAQKYYDTTAMALPKEYPDYNQIMNKTAVLSELVTYAQTIQLQDSLQHLALMDTADLNRMIDDLIAEFKREQERIAEEKDNGGAFYVDNRASSSSSNTLSGGSWYFYNTTALSRGRTEFIRKWGDRKLEDMWFLSDKRIVVQDFETDVADGVLNDSIDSTAVAVAPRITNQGSRSYYLQDIPFTEEQMAISDSLIIEAYSKLAYLYLEALRDTSLARETYFEFQEKYPDNKYKLESWYALYKIFRDEGDFAKSDYYADLVTTNFPESNYAKVIADPDYFVMLAESQNEAAKLYSRAYTAFNRDQYYRVIKYADEAVELFPDDTATIPKFLYLKAMSLGAVDVADSLYYALLDLVQKYPSSSVKPMATSVIRTLQQEYGLGLPSESLVGDSAASVNPSLFKYNPDEMHLVLLLVQAEGININALKVRISDFNKKYFQLKKFRIKSLMFDDTKSIVTIGNFDDAKKANSYLLALKNDEYVVSGLKNKDILSFSISTSNYPILYKDKNVGSYEEFYKKYYSGN